nr:hypothetical protein [Tanacetum cinerariifolium]
ANQILNSQEQKLFDEREKRYADERAAQIALNAFDYETREQQRTARAAEAADIETNSQRAAEAYRRRLAERIANEKALLENRASSL